MAPRRGTFVQALLQQYQTRLGSPFLDAKPRKLTHCNSFGHGGPLAYRDRTAHSLAALCRLWPQPLDGDRLAAQEEVKLNLVSKDGGGLKRVHLQKESEKETSPAFGTQ
ncbi:hypothetical protein Cob_v003969 [Colletotrichum orbiculare MAFF 240422]|uniref:Uncharacterized protein n=1 Tax=Colletotrichum orbiculare (strain 104-T / ATCC 96160 / CBS 514.97 / LARS 414 / MAFF 240422) TaxID=1213857 RepID=A0A484FZC8_COLOR|nr:hypothetical protein Cob_v003969 [Colletotrichum orbiculare MAFF 240422]